MPWDEAIHLILSQADGPLHYTEIADRIASQGLRRPGSLGATPGRTVVSVISTSLLSDKDSPYLRLGEGDYTLKVSPRFKTDTVSNANQEEQVGALGAFGMYWQRSFVFWPGKPRLLGRQGLGATDVNFADQIGVYLLHDQERVVYVGRVTDTLFARLKAHTIDRLNGRWDRFSWFGLRSVSANGELSDREFKWAQDEVLKTMEAVLIESLEPPLNRRRGDNLLGTEYIQTPDQQIEKTKKKAWLETLFKKAGMEME